MIYSPQKIKLKMRIKVVKKKSRNLSNSTLEIGGCLALSFLRMKANRAQYILFVLLLPAALTTLLKTKS